jgi:hypothetical protein
MAIRTTGKRRKCRRSYCPNHYDEDIGAPGSWGKNARGECVPCFFAMQMVELGNTIERIEAFPAYMAEIIPFLEKCGWDWQDVKDSYARINALPAEARESELVM